jgi:hypothetical protein
MNKTLNLKSIERNRNMKTGKAKKAKQNTKQMLDSTSEFFVSRGFWFFFPEKKNKIKRATP